MKRQVEHDLDTLAEVLAYLKDNEMTALGQHEPKMAKSYRKITDRLTKVYRRIHDKAYPAQEA